jgi:hypothetical protein
MENIKETVEEMKYPSEVKFIRENNNWFESKMVRVKGKLSLCLIKCIMKLYLLLN